MMTRSGPTFAISMWPERVPPALNPGGSIMVRLCRAPFFLLAMTALAAISRGDDRPAPPPGEGARRVYGEWRIRVRPDKGPEYDRLIEQSGLPLFREAGGRMVG